MLPSSENAVSFSHVASVIGYLGNIITERNIMEKNYDGEEYDEEEYMERNKTGEILGKQGEILLGCKLLSVSRNLKKNV